MAAFCWVTHIHIIKEEKTVSETCMHSMTIKRSPTSVSGLNDMLKTTSRTNY